MDRKEILSKLTAGQISEEEADRLLGQQMDNRPRGTLYCKVSPKGAISVYGLQRMPVTLYVEQWQRLLDFSDTLRQFAKDNDGQLSRKGEKEKEAAS
jgi:hypothetical protein